MAVAPAHPLPDLAARVRAREAADLSPLATPSYPARRRRPEADHPLRTPFQRDRDRIVHAKAFRRLKHKTQVWVAPEGDHYRTRLTHTLEVTQISRTVARALALNEDLVEAIGLGHDLGHPPFGHIGEAMLDACLRERFGPEAGFRHWEHSLRVVDVLERDGRGLNLSEPVRDGILCHSGRAPAPATLEGAIVRLVDRIAYLNHDVDDALRAGVIGPADLPAGVVAVLGADPSARIDTLVSDLVAASAAAGSITQGPEVGEAMDELREFMFARVYMGPEARAEHARIERVVRTLFAHFCAHPEELPPLAPAEGSDPPELAPAAAGRRSADPPDLARRVTDWIAGMTDRYCVRAFTAIAVPRGWDA
jgi:dGTPase